MRFRNTLMALLVFAGLGAFIYFYEYKGEPARERAERAGKSVLNVERDAIQEIEILKPDAAAVAVRREAEGWRLIRPVETRADAERVDSILGTLTGMEIEQTLAGVTPDEKKQFGIDPPAATVTVRLAPAGAAAAGEDRILLVGDKAPLGSGHYVARAGAPDVMVVTSGLDSLTSVDASTLRYRKIVGLDTWKVSRFRIETPREALALAREAEHWRIESPGPWPADDTQVQNLWFDIQGSEAEGFESENPAPPDLARYGLAPAALSLTVEATEGSAPVRVEFGQPEPGGPVYARRSDLEAVMRAPGPMLDKLRQAVEDPAKLREARVAPVDRFRLTSLELAKTGEEPMTLHKDDTSQWHRGTADGPAVPLEQVNALLDAIDALRATGYVEADAAQPDPALVLRLVEGSGGEARTVETRLLPESGPAGSPRRFRTSGASSIYLVSPDLVTPLLEKAEALRAPASEKAAP